MTTAAQVKKMVQPLLARHTDLALIGRWIYGASFRARRFNRPYA
jgi:hypothetical protein